MIKHLLWKQHWSGATLYGQATLWMSWIGVLNCFKCHQVSKNSQRVGWNFQIVTVSPNAMSDNQVWILKTFWIWTLAENLNYEGWNGFVSKIFQITFSQTRLTVDQSENEKSPLSPGEIKFSSFQLFQLNSLSYSWNYLVLIVRHLHTDIHHTVCEKGHPPKQTSTTLCVK